MILDENCIRTKQHRTHLIQTHSHNSKALLSHFLSAAVEAYELKSPFSPAAHPSKQLPLTGYWHKIHDTAHASLNSSNFGKELVSLYPIEAANLLKSTQAGLPNNSKSVWHFCWGALKSLCNYEWNCFPNAPAIYTLNSYYITLNLLIHTELW